MKKGNVRVRTVMHRLEEAREDEKNKDTSVHEGQRSSHSQ